MGAVPGTKRERVRIGDVLVAQKVITEAQLRAALEAQQKGGRRLGRILVDNGWTTEEQICEALARQLGIRHVNLKFFNFPLELTRRLGETHARRHRALVLEDQGNAYLVGMSDPTDLFASDELERLLKREVVPAVVSETQLLQTIDRVYRRTEEISGLAKELEHSVGETAADFGALLSASGAEDAPVVRLLQTVLEDATRAGASDVHVEPQEARLQIRFRIDGTLTLQTEADVRIAPAVALRLKLMAGLDISEKRLPQDGRFNVRVRDVPVDVRVSTMPTQFGEAVAMRLLHRRGGLISLDGLGIPSAMLARLRQLLGRTSGMIVVTGPTGSGKTTTLYAALNVLNSVERKIITVEDPVEYRLPGINQVQVNEKIGLTFSTVLRSTLRQDPDVILIGEMRDEETVQIALRAALTGHLVFSTLHTREAASSPTRLIDMGAPPYMVGTSIQAVIAQRLVRKICESCAEPATLSAQEGEWVAQHVPRDAVEPSFMHGRGCSHCNGSGFLGRTGVYELLEMGQDLVAAATRNDSAGFIRIARERMIGQTLTDHAFRLAYEGRTTLGEVMRLAALVED